MASKGDNIMTWPPTLGDDLEAVERFRTHNIGDPKPTSEVQTPCCGYKKAADMVIDVRGVNGFDADFVCDGCRHRMFRNPNNAWSWSKLMQKLGAPWKEVREEHKKERAMELRRAAKEKDEAWDPSELMSQAEREVPDQVRDLKANPVTKE